MRDRQYLGVLMQFIRESPFLLRVQPWCNAGDTGWKQCSVWTKFAIFCALCGHYAHYARCVKPRSAVLTRGAFCFIEAFAHENSRRWFQS